MSHRTSATVILDSIGPHGDATRLTSMYVVFPKMVLAERNRHRGFSLSDRSSRAAPPEKLIQEIREDPAMPAKFRTRVKGMGGGKELTGAALDCTKSSWKNAAYGAALHAEDLLEAGLAKEIVNRPLDPFIRMHSLMTATRDIWLNFFGLRLDEGADPTIQVLAQKCFEAYKRSKPELLDPGEWHLPFVEGDDYQLIREHCNSVGQTLESSVQYIARRLSAARCAHLSYNDLETGKKMTIDRALKIYYKLVGSSPKHCSPLEHQATPDTKWIDRGASIVAHAHGDDEHWTAPERHGNFHGWVQHRKLLVGENIAPLPLGYAL